MYPRLSGTAFIHQFSDRQASERESFAQFADARARRQRPLLIENRLRLWRERLKRPEDDILGVHERAAPKPFVNQRFNLRPGDFDGQRGPPCLNLPCP